MSLMEILVAVAVFALIGLLCYGTFAQAVKARDRAEAITSRYHEIRQAMQRMANEISMAFISAHRDCQDKRTETIFVGKRAGNGMRLDFTSFSHFKTRADANESDQNELSYFVDNHPDDAQRRVLYRREQYRIDDEPQEDGVEQILAEDVTELEFEFYDPKEDEWEDEWDSDGMDFKYRVPAYVTIKLKALDHKGDEELFVTKTRIFVNKQIYLQGVRQCLD